MHYRKWHPLYAYHTQRTKVCSKPKWSIKARLQVNDRLSVSPRLQLLRIHMQISIYLSIYLQASVSHILGLHFSSSNVIFFFKLDLSTCWEHFYASYSPTSNLLIFLRRGCKWHRVRWHFLGSSLQINTWLIMQIRVTNISEIAPRKGGDLKLLWNTNTPLKPTVMKLSDED